MTSSVNSLMKAGSFVVTLSTLSLLLIPISVEAAPMWGVYDYYGLSPLNSDTLNIDSPPQILTAADVIYTGIDLPEVFHDTTFIEVRLDSSATVMGVIIDRSCGIRNLDIVSVHAAWRTIWQPARLGGKYVPSVAKVMFLHDADYMRSMTTGFMNTYDRMAEPDTDSASIANSHSYITREQLQIASCTIYGYCRENDPLFDDEYEWQGSGFVLLDRSDTLHIVTNRHVLGIDNVTENPDEIFSDVLDILEYELVIEMADGRWVKPEHMACHIHQDIAFLAFAKPTSMPKGEAYIVLDPYEPVDYYPGDRVFAVGAGLRYQGTITSGVISAIRELPSSYDEDVNTLMIQTDAAINPGNSGGPLLLEREDHYILIGVNSSTCLEGEGVGFAIDTFEFFSGLELDDMVIFENSPEGFAYAVRELYEIDAVCR